MHEEIVMTKGVILVTDQVFGDFSYEQKLAAKENFELFVASEKKREAMLQANKAGAVRAIYNTYYGPVNGELMDQFKELRGVVRCGIGVDTIDLNDAKARNVRVANVPDYCIEEVAGHAVAMFLSLARKLTFSDKLVRQGKWSIPAIKPMKSFSEYTCGVVGLGRIGRKAAGMLASLVKKVIYFDPVIKCDDYEKVSLERLYAEADAIFLHVPLIDQTRGMMNRSVFSKLEKKPLLINVSRGGLVVTDDLVAAMKEGKVSGAGLDIADGIDNGVTSHPLMDCENVVLTPHSAWYSEQAMVKLRESAIAEAIRMAKGEEPRNRVA
jgi:D-3-phosphoglycerate dehydrogenase